MPKLIASDLDGTILRNGAQTLPEGFTDLIMALKSHGIHFAAASGRQYQNIRRLFAPIEDQISYIAENGSLCLYEGEVISRGNISHELGLEIMREIQKFDDLNILLSCESTSYIESGNPEFIHHMRDVVGYDIQVMDDILSVEEPYLKIAACDFSGNSQHVAHFKERFQGALNVVTSGNIWFDFIAPGADKGSGLQKMIEKMQIRPYETIAFGDQYNDIEMLMTAGTGYAMRTAAPGIDRFADSITESVEEVLREILEEYE